MTASSIPIRKVCEFCGKEFVAGKITTRFCSSTCNNRAYKQKLRRRLVSKAEEESQRTKADFMEKSILSIGEAATLMGITPRSVYNLIYSGKLKAAKLSSRMTLLRKSDIEAMLASCPYTKHRKKPSSPITEFYTTEEIMEKYGVSMSCIYATAKTKKFPKLLHLGRTLWSKKHIDAHFGKKIHDSSITEWYTVEEIKEKFGMTTSAVYCFASSNAIPKKKEKCMVYYSKCHVDMLKGHAKEQTIWLSTKEAMARHHLTRDQLYGICKRFNIPKKQEGRNVYIAQRELNGAMKPPSM